MSTTITLRVPESLYAEVKRLAKDKGVSLNQYVQTALAEKLAQETDFDKRFKNLDLEFRVAPKGRRYDY